MDLIEEADEQAVQAFAEESDDDDCPIKIALRVRDFTKAEKEEADRKNLGFEAFENAI